MNSFIPTAAVMLAAFIAVALSAYVRPEVKELAAEQATGGS
jgi:hypothetical protein